MADTQQSEAELLKQTEDVDIPLASNSLWNDVNPILQNDGPHTGKFVVCRIGKRLTRN